MATVHDAAVRVELDEEFPAALHWSSRRWTVIDAPTRLGITDDVAYAGVITHPPTPWLAWRFTARADDGDVRVFDIRYRANGWDLIRTYR
jgi:hypothetical protein